MKVASADDVSSRVQPQLAAAGAAASANAEGEQGGSAPVVGAAAVFTAAEAQQEQQQGMRPGARRVCSLPPSHFVLSLDQLAEHGYPLPRLDEGSGAMVCPEGFVATQSCTGEARVAFWGGGA